LNVSTVSSFTLHRWASVATKNGWYPQVVSDMTGTGRADALNHNATAETWCVNESTGSTFTLTRWHP
jgi:hypothetical protein